MRRTLLSWIILIFLLLDVSSTVSGCRSINQICDYPKLQYGAEGSDSSLLVIQGRDGYYGYGDASGKIIIDSKFDEARPFYNGLAAVKRGSRYGYIDMKGRTVIPFRYYQALDFHGEKTIVGTELDGSIVAGVKCSIIDKQGKLIKDTPFYIFSTFSDGYIVASCKNDECYLDSEYNELRILSTDLNVFNEGYTVYKTDKQKFSYMDKAGNSLPCEFDSGKPFSGGYASVIPDMSTELWGYIDKTGHLVIPAQFKYAYGFGEGLACVTTKDGENAIIDETGKVIYRIDDQFWKMGVFSEGLCAVAVYHKIEGPHNDEDEFRWGFIDNSGKTAIDIQFENVTPFKNGIAQVLIDGKIAYIDKTGKYIWGPR